MLPAQLPFAFDAWDRFLIYERRVAAPGQATMTRRASRLEHRATRGLPPSLAASFHVRDHSTAASDAPSVPMTDAALPAGSGSLQCYSEICIFAGRSKAKGGAKVPPPASTAASGPATPGSAAPGTPDAPSTLHLDDVSQPEVGRSAAASPAAKRSKDPPMFQLLRIPRTNNPKLQCVVASTTFESEEAARHYAKRRRLTPLMDAVALIGAVRFTMGYYLVLVTRRSQCAVLGAHPVYDIKQTQLLYIGEHNRDQTQGDEQRLRDTFLVLDLKSGAFFYSYTLDLTHPLQRVMAAQRPPAPRDKFVWNSFLAEPWRQCDLGELVVPIVRGCVLQRHMTIGTSSVLLTMVVRGSKRFAGARYLKRGVNEEGHVANHVEVEQIVSDESQMSPDRSRGAFTSFVQVRGSVPVFWCHDGGLKPKPAILYDRIDNTYKATKCHFGELFADYGAPVVILNLLKEQERKPREIHLSAAFRRAIDTIVAPLGQQAKPSPGEPFDPPLQYAAFDFRNRTREAWNELTAIAEYVVDRVGFFHTSPKGALRWQCGVARSNCVDCVDRTNYGQFFTGLHALSHQLVALNVFECPTDIATTPALREQLLLLYTELGDRIATQYGGSMVVSAGLFDRGLGWDKFMGLKRFYTNRFEDDERQRATNLFLGLYRPCVPRPLPGTVVSVDCPSAYQVPPRPTAETSLLASMWRMVRSEQVQALPGEDSVWVRAIDIDQLDSDYYLHVKHPVAMLALHEGQVPAALMSPTNLAGSIRPLMPGPRASAAPPPPQPMAFVANSFGQSPKDNAPLPGSMASIPDHALQPASMPRSEEVLGARDRDGPTSQGSLHIPAPELDSAPVLAGDEPQSQPESQPQSAEPQPQDDAPNASVEKETTPARRDGNDDDDDDDNVDDAQRCGGSAEAEAAGSNGVSVEGQSDPVPVSAMTPSTLKGGSVGGGMEGASVSDLFGPYATTTSVTAVATPAPTPVGACVSPPPEHEMVLSRNPGLNLEAGGMLLRKDSTLVEMALETRDAEPNQWLAVALAQHSKSCAMRTAPGPRPRDAGHDIEYELGKLALPSDLFRIVDVSTQTHIPLQKYEKLDALNAQAARHQKPPYVCKQEMNETRPPDPPPRSYTAPPIDYSVMTDITAYAEEVERSPYCVAEEKMLQIAQDAVQPRKHEDITEQEWRVMGLSLQQPGPYTAWSIDDLCSALKAFRWQRGPPLRHLANELTAMMTSLYFARPSDAVGGFFRAFLVPPSLARSERKVHVTPARRQMVSVSASPGPNTQADTRPPTPQAPSVTPPATPLVPVTFPALTPPRKIPTVSMAALDAPGSGVSPRPVTPQSVLRRDRARTAPLAVFDPVGTLEQWYVVSATDEDRGWIRDFVAAAKHCPRRAVAADYEAYVQGSDTVMRRMLGAAPTPTVHPLTTFLNTTATQVELERRVRGWLSLICDPRDGIRPQNRVRYVNADSIRIPRGVIHLNVFSGHNLVSWVVSNAHHLKITLPGHSAWNAASTFASLLITSGLLHAVTSSTTTAAAAQDRTIVSDTTRFTRSVEPRALYRLLCHEPRHVFQPPVAMARPTEALTPDDIMVLSHTVCNLALQYLDEATATHQSLIESVSSQLLPALEFCSLQALTPGMRACLFTNLYNTLYCLIVARCRRRNQRFDIDIAEHTQYIVVAGMQFSLADIKHGILRGNAPHPRMLLPQISEDDSRLRLVLDSPDPRCVMLLLDFVEGRVDSSDKAKNPQAPNSSDSEDSDPDDDEDEDEDEAVAASKHTTRVKETNQRLASTPTAAPLPLPPSSSELAAEDLTTGWFWWWRTESRGELDLLKCTAVLYDDWHQRLQLAASHTLHLLSSGYAGEGAAGAKPSDSAARVMQTLRTLPEFGSSRESVFRRLRDVSRR